MLKYLFIMLVYVSTLVASEQDTMKSYVFNEGMLISALRADENSAVTQKTLRTSDIQLTNYSQESSVFLTSTPSIIAYADNGSSVGYTYYRLRGMDQTRINATLNGVPLNEPEDQGAYTCNYVDFFSSLSSIQIQRGIGTASNGTASYAGSINYESKNLTDTTVAASLNVGSYNTQINRFEYSTGKMKNNFAFYARYSNAKSDGYRYNSGNKSESGFFSAGYITTNEILKLVAFTGHSVNSMAWLPASEADIKIDPRTNYLSSNETDDFYQTMIQLHYIKDADGITSTVTGYYGTLHGHYGVAVPDLLDFRLKSELFGASTTMSMLGNNGGLVIGLHANFYNRTHSMALPDNMIAYTNTGYKDEVSAFTKLSNITDRVTFEYEIQARGVMFRYEPEKSYGISVDPISWLFLNPKIGCSYDMLHNDRLYASFGRVDREPTRNDMFSGADDISENKYNLGAVKAGRVYDLELGYTKNSDFYSFTANVFHMQFENEIVPIGQLSAIGLPLRKNVNSSYRQGIEFDGTLNLSNNVVVSANSTLMRAQIDTYPTDSVGIAYSNITPTMTPASVSNVSMTYSHSIFSITGNARYVSSAWLDNANVYKMPGNVTLSANASVAYNTVSLTVYVNNITDDVSYDSGYVIANTPQYFVASQRNYNMVLQVKL